MSSNQVRSIRGGPLETSSDSVASGGGGGYDDDMEKRLERLEEAVATIKVDVATILSNFSTKADVVELKGATTTGLAEVRADLHKIHSDISRWTLATIVTVIGAMIAAVVGLSAFHKNTAPPEPKAPVQQAPIVIYAQPAAPPLK